MDWKKERDALIAQTLAFVQAVAVKTEATPKAWTEGPAVAPPQPAAPPAPLARQAPAPLPAAAPKREPVEPAAVARPDGFAPLSLPSLQTDIKREIQDRIANFRAHQERFNRERAEYVSATLARLRATTEPSPPSPPAK